MKKILFILLALMLSACNTVIVEKQNDTENDGSVQLAFDQQDSDASYSVNGSTYIALADEDINISKAGTYILQGELNGSVIVEVNENSKVQLVLDNVNIHAGDFAGIYIIEADEVEITLADGTDNYIEDSSTYTQIDTNGVDALIYSKADLLINGTGTLNLTSSYNHGIVSKDDLIIASGNFNIDVAGQGLKGKDCVKIADGNFNITSGKDAIKSDNDTDAGRGYVYIEKGTFNINSDADGIYAYNLLQIEDGDFKIQTNKSSTADSYKAIKSDHQIVINGGSYDIDSADDGIHSNVDILITGGNFEINSVDDAIHGDGKVEIDDGNFNIVAKEAIEATYVLINSGNFNISASDDGINAGQKVNDYVPTIEINGGEIVIVMGQGDTDAIDSNGNIIVNGGTINITAQSAFDYDQSAQFNGGSIIVNGQEVTQIENQMMGGGMFGQNGGGFNPGGAGGFGPGGGNPGDAGGFGPGGGNRR